MTMVPKTQSWDEFFKGMETGDMILMHGLFDSSIFIETISDCNWSHAALIVISDDIGLTNLPSGTVLLWESNIMDSKGKNKNPNNLSVTDVILNRAKDGPILDHFKERITNNHTLKYDGDVAKRKLNFNRSPQMFAKLKNVIQDIHNDSFPSIPWGEMSHFVEGRLANIPVTDGTYFCSQLVAHTYKAWGLMNSDHVDNWYAPANFSNGSWAISLEGGATLGDEVGLDLSTIPAYPGY